MDSQSSVAIGLVAVLVCVTIGAVGYCLLQVQISETYRLVAQAQPGNEPEPAPKQDADEPEPDSQQGVLNMGPFTWSHFLTVSIFILGIGATALGWLLGQKQDKAACEKRHGAEGSRWQRVETNQTWIIDALRRIAENGGTGRTKLPDPPSHPDVDERILD